VRLDAAAVAAEVVEYYEPADEQKGVVFSFETDGQTPVTGDPVLLAQAVSNLIDNSLKSVPAAGAISVRVARRADAVEIAVADNGPGIAAADRPKATERFFRGDASRGSPGVGLGLSIVDAVAKLHGGVLQLLDNHPGLLAQMVLPVTAARSNR
jgi:signal transduction histidine kinase